MKMARSSRHYITGLAAVAAVVLVLAALAGPGVAGSKSSEKGYIGVYMQELDQDLREGLDIDIEYGVLINHIEDGSPADEAGIKEGDVIVEFDGNRITSTDLLRELVADTEVGDEIKVKVIRDGKTRTLTIEVGDWPDDNTWHSLGDLHFDKNNWRDFGTSVRTFMFKPRLGVQATELNEGLASYFKTDAGEGVLVLEVNEESVAEEAGILAGDVIKSVDGEEVTTVDELRASMTEFEEGDELKIVVLRKGKSKTLTATMDNSGENFLWSGRSPHVYKFEHNLHPQNFSKSFGPHMEVLKDDIHDELEELKQELKKMKKELKELKNR